MSALFSKEGFRRLRASWILLALSVAAAATIGAGGQWYLGKEQRDAVASKQRLQEARGRLEGARRERDSLAASAELFRGLQARGILGDERRLELIELVAQLRNRFGIVGLDYEIAPQRPLPGTALGAVDVLSSRVKFKLRALHEGDVLGFLDALAHAPRGLYPVDRCAIRRLEQASADDYWSARVEADCQIEWITVMEKNRGPRPG